MHVRITVWFTNDTKKILVVNKKANGMADVRIEDGVAHFGRTQDGAWVEFVAAPLTSIYYWD